MIKLIITLIILTSCAVGKCSDTVIVSKTRDPLKSNLVNSNLTMKTDTITLSNKIDKVEILCLSFGEHTTNSFSVFLSNSRLQILSPYDGKEILFVSYGEEKNKLIEYINQLYIDKEKKIILNKTNRGYIKSADYPSINVVGYQNKKERINRTITLGDDVYDVKYSPKFIEFYEFLERLGSKE